MLNLFLSAAYARTSIVRYFPRNWFELFSIILLSVNNLEMETILLGDVKTRYNWTSRLYAVNRKSNKNYSWIKHLKGATRLYFTHYICVVIILFNTGSCYSANSTYSFAKLLFLSDYKFLSCHVRVSEWIHTLQLPEYQGTPCSKQARNLNFMWLERGSNPQPLSS